MAAKKEIPEFVFNDLVRSMEQGVAVSRGKITAKTFKLERSKETIGPKDITEIRDSLNVSQDVFARMLNVSKSTAVSWERGHRKPSGAAVRLLQIARKKPSVLADVR